MTTMQEMISDYEELNQMKDKKDNQEIMLLQIKECIYLESLMSDASPDVSHITDDLDIEVKQRIERIANLKTKNSCAAKGIM
jgi:hypothetical protein